MSYIQRSELSQSPVRQIPTQGSSSPYVKSNVPYPVHMTRMSVDNTTAKKTSQPLFIPNHNSQLPRAYESTSPSKFTRIHDDAEVELMKQKNNHLQNSLCQVSSDLELANFRARKARELEDKVESLLKRNQQLIDENEGVSKNFNQKKTESEIWKSKYETQMNAMIAQKTSFERELRLLQDENQILKTSHENQNIDRMRESESSKNQIIYDNHSQIEALQRSHMNNIALYDEQLRKLREIVEDREKEIAELQVKVNHHKNEGDIEANRLSEERDRLRTYIAKLELSQQEQLDALKRKLEFNFAEQTKNLNELHKNQINVLEDEISKLKKLFELKNDEISTLMDQNRGQKNNYEDENVSLRDEIRELKDKIRELNVQHDQNLRAQSENAASIHQCELTTLQIHHENQVASLNGEINKLNEIIANKNKEIDIQIQQNIQQSKLYSDEKRRLTTEIEKQHLRYSALERKRDEELADADTRLDRANLEATENHNKQIEHIRYINEEIDNLKALVNQKNEEIQKQYAQSESCKRILEHDLKAAREQINNLQKLMDAKVMDMHMMNQELKHSLQKQSIQYSEKFKELTERISTLEREKQIIRDNLSMKEEENNKLNQLKNLHENEIKKLQFDNDDKERKINLIEQSKYQELEILRVKLETSNNEIIQSIKQSHQNQLDISNARENDVRSQLANKEREFFDLISKYEHIVAAYVEGKQLNPSELANKDIFEASAQSKYRTIKK